MTDSLRSLESLRRPRLLIAAARFGVADYRRNPHLHRLLGASDLPRSGVALDRLMAMELGLESQRKAGVADYSVRRHIEVLVAMMGEAHLLRATFFAPLRAVG